MQRYLNAMSWLTLIVLLGLRAPPIMLAQSNAAESDHTLRHAAYVERQQVAPAVFTHDQTAGRKIPSTGANTLPRFDGAVRPAEERTSVGGRINRGTVKTVLSTISSLFIVAGLFLATAWLFRRGNGKQNRVIASDLCEVLGNVHLTHRHQAHVVRFADKLLLLSLTSSGARLLGETDLDAVADQRWRQDSQVPGEAHTSRVASPQQQEASTTFGDRLRARVLGK